MAVLQMQRISICGLKKERKRIMEFLQRQGNIEINETMPQDSVFQKSDVSAAISSLERNVSTAKEALVILNSYSPENVSMLASLSGRSELPAEKYDQFYEKHETVISSANRICALSRKIEEQKADILRFKAQSEMLTLWASLDIPLSFSGTKHTTALIGTLPGEWTADLVAETLGESIPAHITIIGSSREQTCIFVLSQKNSADTVSESLRTAGFAYATVSSDKPPLQQQQDLQDEILSAQESISAANDEIVLLAGIRDDLKFLADYDTMRMDKYKAISHLLQSKNVFVLTGYIPHREADTLSKQLSERFEVAVELDTPAEDEDVPVLLDNNGFSAPLESTIESYSLPSKGEIDPTMMVSLFYYMLFGLMLSDAGYGAIIALACAIGLLKFGKTMETPMKKTLKMYLFCGLATVFWGIMFGSYFGDVVDVVSRTFFNKQITIPPLWFFPVNEPMRMMVFSLLIGIVHIFAGLGIKLYMSLKQKDYKGAIYDVVLWYTLIIGCIVALLSMEMVQNIFGLTFEIPQVVVTISMVVAAASALGIILTSGRESKNPFKRFLKGLYGLYGISGYLSDILSYSRLLALGLATGVIGTVINTMAAMPGKSIVGVIAFVVIFIAGHTINLGINALGAYVHTNRLSYVEFFGKFYEGGGRKFNPFNTKTKFYKFRED